jgi:hypothetical protein
MNSDGSLSQALQNDNENLSSFEEFFKTEYQDDETAIKHHVRIDSPYVDFGAVTNINDEIPQQKSITLFNNTKGKLFICWNKSNDDKTFTISPQTAEIPPLKSYSFRIKFKPVIKLKQKLKFYFHLSIFSQNQVNFMIPYLKAMLYINRCAIIP